MNTKSLIIFLLSLVVFLPAHLIAQKGNNSQKSVLQETNQEKLKALSQKWNKEWEAEYGKALRLAKKHDWVIREEKKDGTVIELVGLGPDSMPIYYTTNNEDAAATTSTNDLWPGGQTNLGLTGFGETIGEWDGGKVLNTHQEFSGRVVQRDNSSRISEHATHVAGTIVAEGKEPGVQGMAYKAELDAYSWINDESEMSTAASGGLYLSNHSYGRITGFRYVDDSSAWLWYGNKNINESEDYRFGFYNSNAERWDEIANNAPYYLIVKSAGNDRNDDGPNSGDPHYYRNNQFDWVKTTKERDADGKYDCIPPKGTAKNILTVGAVKDIPGGYSSPSDVKITKFSSWGPTDDGRIKPDLVGNGKSLKSTDDNNDQAYTKKSGTSMSAPNVTGSLALLQSLFKDINGGTPMKAALLKALAIHTADEAGNAPGPDYKFGWGLMNAKKAANLIINDTSQNNLQLLTLQDNSTSSFKVTADGQEPLVATISWSDEKGTPPSASLDPNQKMLVNDLDLRIMDSTNQTYYPWKLDPANPSNAATKGDNKTDNVEQVIVRNPVPGATYTIQIDHKGNLSGSSQELGLVLSGLATSSVNVTCQDTTEINKNYGFLDDGSGGDAYANNANCYWELTAPNGKPLHLDFTKFNTANPGDTLFIYEGHSTNNQLIRQLTGQNKPATINTGTDQIMLRFKTDGSFSSEGWAFQFGSYDPGACWGVNMIDYVQAGSANSGFIWQLKDEYAQTPSSRFKLTEAGEAITDWINRDGEQFSADFPMKLDSFYVGVTHENNSGNFDTFEVYVRTLDVNGFPSGPVLWRGQRTTNNSLSPSGDYNSTQNAARFLTFKPGIMINQKFFIGVRYHGSRLDSAGIVGYFENVGTSNNPRAGEASLGKAYRRHASSNLTNQWQPRPDGNEQDYVDWNQNGQYDKANNEAPFFQMAYVVPMVSKVAPRPSKPVIQKQGDKLVVQGNYQNYQWFRDGNQLSGQNGSSINLTAEGSYQVFVYGDYINCGRSSDPYQYEKQSSSVAHPDNPTISVFPNPSEGIYHLNSANPERLRYFRVISSRGKVVFNETEVDQSATEINLKNQEAGIYYLELVKSNGVRRIKLIKQ